MLSVVIPVWSGTPLLTKMHIELAASVRNMCDELIICEDGPWQRELYNIADSYWHRPKRLGHAQNLQLGINIAHGNFIGVLDADVVIKKGSLRNLCVPNRFVEGKCLNQGTDRKDVFYIWCSVGPKYLYEMYPFPTHTEILDSWATSIDPDLIVKSDLVEYEHHTGIVYTEMKRVHPELL